MYKPQTTYETMASDALERLAKLLGISNDPDDPEPALIAAVERAVNELVIARRPLCNLSTQGVDDEHE